MKLRIILIEDKKNEQEQWRAMLKEWEKRSSVLVNAEIFDSAEAFLESDQNHTSNIHAIFLDISLSGINGIEAAKRIREARIQSDIIFLTAYREYVFDGYSVDAMDYLLKPLSQSIFDKCLRKLLDRYMNGTYIFRSNNEIIQIPYCDILYLSSRAHNVEITTLQGTISHRRNIKDLLSILPSNFVRIHRTAIINIHHIQRLDGYTILMTDNTSITVSRSYYKEVRDKLLQYII